MKHPALLTAFLLPLLSISQPQIEPMTIGAQGHSIEERFRCDDLAWKIIGMDPGTSLGISKMNLSFNMLGGDGGLISIGGGCRIDGPPSQQTSTFVTVTTPITIWPGTVINAQCEAGRFVYIERIMRR